MIYVRETQRRASRFFIGGIKMEKQKQTLRPTPTAILNPRLDVNFKALFTQGTKESDAALQSFISAAVGRKIKSLKLDPNEPAVDAPSQMQMSFDVAVTFDDGEKASIEMQGRDREYDYAARSEVQAARLLNNNAKKGGEWQANRVYQISVLNFHFKNGDKSEMSWYTMKDDKGNGLADRLNVIFIDLLTIKRLVGTPVKNLTPLQKWGLFFSYADDESKAEYVSQIAKSEEGIMEADRIAQRMSEEDANWFRQNSIDIARRDRNAELSAYREKGLREGRQKGRQEGLAEGAAQKALEDAVIAIKKFHIPIDDVVREYKVDKVEIEKRLQLAEA